jgi:hypothetical protein
MARLDSIILHGTLISLVARASSSSVSIIIMLADMQLAADLE